jgi:hypothetical protein
MVTNTSELREQLRQLQDELASRRSIVHFAHAAVSTLMTLVAGGLLAHVLYQGQDVRFAWLLGVLCTVGVSYALVRSWVGRKWLRHEDRRFEALQAVRGALRLDDPEALLPR